VPDTFLRKYVVHLRHLGMKVEPPLGVVLYELPFGSFLRYYEICLYLGVPASIEVCEIAACQVFRAVGYLVVVALAAEYVLLLKGVPFAEGLHYVCEDILKEHITLRVGA